MSTQHKTTTNILPYLYLTLDDVAAADRDEVVADDQDVAAAEQDVGVEVKDEVAATVQDLAPAQQGTIPGIQIITLSVNS